jgi:hypothetical protein
MVINMALRTLLPLVIVLAMMAQIPRPHQISPRPDEQVPLPNAQMPPEEIRKADYEKSLNDVRELAKLAEDLNADLEKTDRFSISLSTVKKTEEIEKLAKRIRVRIKRF